jgi:hypothetical protein
MTTTMSQRNAHTHIPAPIPRRPTHSATVSATHDGGDIPTAINTINVTGTVNTANTTCNTDDTDTANDGSAPRSRRSTCQGAATATTTAPGDTRVPEMILPTTMTMRVKQATAKEPGAVRRQRMGNARWVEGGSYCTKACQTGCKEADGGVSLAVLSYGVWEEAVDEVV